MARLLQHNDTLEHAGIQGVLTRAMPQPFIGFTLVCAAAITVTLAWAERRPPAMSGMDTGILGMLAMGVAASRIWPIRVGRATRIYIASIPLYLLCCLFAPVLAAVAAGIGIATGEIWVCRRCANTAGDVTAQIGRWTLLAFLVSTTFTLWPADSVAFAGTAAGLLLWAGDVITCPLVFSPITGQDPWHVMRTAAQQSYLGEMMQYLIALLALLLVRSGLLWTGILWIDAASASLIVLPILLLYVYLKSIDADSQHGTA